MLRLNDSGYNLTAFVRQNITKSARHLTDNSMGAKHPEPMGDTSRQTPPDIDIMVAGIEMLQNILISKTSYIEFPPADYLKKICVFFVPWAKGANPLAFPMNRAANRLYDFSHQKVHLDRSKSVQIPLIGCLRKLCPPMQISNAFAHSFPGTGALRIPLSGAIHLEISYIVHCGLDAQNTSMLVIGFDRVCLEAMLDSDAFDTMPIMADDLPLEIAMWFFTQKPHHILAAENRNTAAHQSRIDTGQRFRGFEHDIRGPFTLVGRPIIRFPKRRQHGLVSRIQTTGDFVQLARPVCLQLLLHQLLGFVNLINPGKTIVASLITNSNSIHLPCQPFSSIEANLDGKWKPALNSCVHETEYLINPVMIKKQALSYSRLEFKLFLFPVAKYFITLTKFHGGQNANQPLADSVSLSNFAGLLLFICFGRRKVNDRASLLASLCAGCLFQLFAFVQKQLATVFQSNFHIPKIVHHATFDGQGSQGAAQNQPVKTAKMPDDLFFIFCYKVVHGVLLSIGDCWRFQQYIRCVAISILFFRWFQKTHQFN